jgi:signal transduction histidine kinase
MLTQQPAEVTLAQILDASPNGIITYEATRNDAGHITDFVFVRLNQTARHMLNLPADVVGRPMLEQLPGVVEAGLYDQVVAVVETGQPLRRDLPFPAGDALLWYNVAVVKLDDGFVITFSDITHTRQIALENERRRVQLDGIVHASLNGIITYEAVRNDADEIVNFRAVTINPVAQRALALPDTQPGWLMLERFPSVGEWGLFDKYVQVVQTGEPLRFETPYNEDGVSGWYDVAVVRLGDGFVITFNNISDRKRAALALEAAIAENQRQAQQLQTVIDTSQTGIILISPVQDAAGALTDFWLRVVNQRVGDYVGQPASALIGGLASEWFPDYYTNGLLDRYRHTWLTGELQRFELRYYSSRAGGDIWFDVMATKLNDDVLVTFADFTTLKQVQQQLEASVLDLKRSNRNLEQFAYVASHDLQEPLRKIQQFGDIIRANYAPLLGETGADLIGRMQSAANRMQVLIKDVLAYSRVATRQQATAPVDLNAVLADVLGDLETAIDRSGAVIGADPLPTLPGDAAQLRQLLQNLLANAIKFTRPGQSPRITIGSTTVRGRATALPVAAPDADRLFQELTVSDNGIGFEAHQAEQIFQVFQRLHGRSHYEGTGIGLAIVQKVVENHGGYIRAEGRPGAGATFRLLLPAE